ncbi:hypothetical protein S40293_04265 [Stachybotrys chartarum IBT 40293]|nr:hypothetical protein S40293_04265 [Stachybotrys chartarum IBT 40293]
MASKRPMLPRHGRLGLPSLAVTPKRPDTLSVCLFCSLAAPKRARLRSRKSVTSPRFSSAAAPTAPNPRAQLEHSLAELQARFPTLVNISRVQLALQGLRQSPGQEAVRVAIFGLANESNAGQTARSVLRAVLADPLKDEEEWERELQELDPTKPLIVRVGPLKNQNTILTISKSHTTTELSVSSAIYNGLNLELLLMDVDIPSPAGTPALMTSLEEALLVPAINIPSADDRFTPITTPVHKAILVADGFSGAVNVSTLPLLESGSSILPVVNMKGLTKEQLGVDFDVIDASMANTAIDLFRKGPQHAIEYERKWFASNLPHLVNWLRTGIKGSEDETKPAVRRLVASVLQNTLAAIQKEESLKMSETFNITEDRVLNKALNDGLTAWAQNAHAELQDELDAAFTSRRWRKLGWWKLFWRVDDVAMLTSEMLSQRFLPTAEKELIYLAGRVAQMEGQRPAYPQPDSPSPVEVAELKRAGTSELEPLIPTIHRTALPKWPGHITFTRRYLQDETVPALQALAQKLVMQSLSLSSLTSSLAALLYVSSFASTVYEAGAVAAFGIVYSLNRLQKKWETARDFWEGEVREEGRKAVRAAEQSVGTVLEGPRSEPLTDTQAVDDLRKARDLVAEAEDALAQLK